MLVVCLTTNLIDSVNFAIVESAYIIQTYHSALPPSPLVAEFGGMAFTGTLILATIGHRLPRRLIPGISFTTGGTLRFWFLLIPTLPILVSRFTLAGLAMGPVNSLIATVLQKRTPPELRAHSWGVLSATLIAMGRATLALLVNPGLKQTERAAARTIATRPPTRPAPLPLR
jgi:hypothetical protein